MRKLVGCVLMALAFGAMLAPEAVRAEADSAGAGGIQLSIGKEFAQALDLSAIRLIAVQEGGRVKTFDSLAREKLKYVNPEGSRKNDPILLYLDMMLSPEHYQHSNVIFIKKPFVRREIIQNVRNQVPAGERDGLLSEAELDRIQKTGLVSLQFLDHPLIQGILSHLQRDLMRTNKYIRALHGARNIAHPASLRGMLRVIPPPGGTKLDPWFSFNSLSRSGMPEDSAHQGVGSSRIPGLDPAVGRVLRTQWQNLERAWINENGEQANEALNLIATAVADVEPSIYPSGTRLGWEHWYYKNFKMTWTWILYCLSLPFLLMGVIYRFPFARRIGLGIFLVSFSAHTFSIVLRWYLAGRIPNSNMFEAILASAWFGCVVALVLEFVLRKKAFKNIPAFCAATYAMLAMMIAFFLPVTLNNDIATVMPVLDRTIWLYIHTNIVIASYALIFFGGVSALLYMGARLIAALRPTATAVAMQADGSSTEEDFEVSAGGALAMIQAGTGERRHGRGDAGMARVFDGATMVFLQLAFLMLWAGTILGAIWADVSWGRPWGWDPKEVFALNTWIIFLVLVHVRLKVRDKGLWTAILALIGCAVMLFNWIAVNFVIVGLHSYA